METIRWMHFDLLPDQKDIGSIVSYEILDPEKQYPNEKRFAYSYCIGFKYNGGDPTNPKSYTYYHTNYWEPDERDLATERCRKISKKKIVAVLNKHSLEINDVLLMYLDIAGSIYDQINN